MDPQKWLERASALLCHTQGEMQAWTPVPTRHWATFCRSSRTRSLNSPRQLSTSRSSSCPRDPRSLALAKHLRALYVGMIHLKDANADRGSHATLPSATVCRSSQAEPLQAGEEIRWQWRLHFQLLIKTNQNPAFPNSSGGGARVKWRILGLGAWRMAGTCRSLSSAEPQVKVRIAYLLCLPPLDSVQQMQHHPTEAREDRRATMRRSQPIPLKQPRNHDDPLSCLASNFKWLTHTNNLKQHASRLLRTDPSWHASEFRFMHRRRLRCRKSLEHLS